MASPGTSSSNSINEAGSRQEPHPSVVGISSFVTIKLSGETDYRPWKEQMMCFLEYHDKVGFIDGTIKNPKFNIHSENEEEMITKYREWKRSDILVKGWIFGTLSEDVLSTVLRLDDAYQVWEKIKRKNDDSLKAVGAQLYTEKQISSNANEHKDIAYELICEYPNLAISEDLTKTPLWFIVQNQHLYVSATRYNSYQRFIYSHVSIEENISKNDNMKPDIENPGMCSTKCKKSVFYTVPHTKHLQEEKSKYQKAHKILERICEEIGKINNMSKIYNRYCGAFNSAV